MTGLIVAAVAGGVVAVAATLGVVATMSATPEPSEQVRIVQYADS